VKYKLLNKSFLYVQAVVKWSLMNSLLRGFTIMNKYIFICESSGHSSELYISAKNERDAIAKAREYWGGRILTNDEFRILCESVSMERIAEVFYETTGEYIVYFAKASDECFINDFKEI